MTVEYCVISIGALSRNRLWGEAKAVRAAHATTTLVWDGERRILVDPSLPGEILAARFGERTGQSLSHVTDVFCTTLRPVHRRGLAALGHARWWCNQQELETYREHLQALRDSAQRLSGPDAEAVEADLELLKKFSAAPEKFGPQIHLYPLAGPSVGSAGLLLTPATTTIAVAGDAALTGEHLRRGQVWQGCADTGAATESFKDLIEVADVIICGHDNLTLCPRQWF